MHPLPSNSVKIRTIKVAFILILYITVYNLSLYCKCRLPNKEINVPYFDICPIPIPLFLEGYGYRANIFFSFFHLWLEKAFIQSHLQGSSHTRFSPCIPWKSKPWFCYSSGMLSSRATKTNVSISLVFGC